MNRKELLHLQKKFLRISNLVTDQFMSKGKDATKKELDLVNDYTLLMKLIDEQVSRNMRMRTTATKRKCETKSFREKLIDKIRRR